MQKLTLIILLFFFTIQIFGQKIDPPLKPQLLGIHLAAVDYNSPTLIRRTSLEEVLSKGDIFNPFKQSPALSISYWRGLTRNLAVDGKCNGISYHYISH